MRFVEVWDIIVVISYIVHVYSVTALQSAMLLSFTDFFFHGPRGFHVSELKRCLKMLDLEFSLEITSIELLT